MATVNLKGNPVSTIGYLPNPESDAPDFELVQNNLSRITLDELKGTKLVLNVFPSLDTGVCAASVRRFNKEAADLNDVKVLCISRDTPFAQSRFCGAEGINNVETLSDFATGQFGIDYGLILTTGPMEGFLSRCIIIIDEEGKIAYTQQVPEITTEPDYDDVLTFLKS